jgi:Leucine-rich repeat (LRR) protein
MCELDLARVYEYESNVGLDFATFDVNPKKLISLNVEGNDFNNVEVISQCYNLRKLNVSMCNLTTISFLENLKQLEELNISFNEEIVQEADYHILKNMNKLRKLNMAFGNVSDRSIFFKGKYIFEYMPQLEYLNVRDNKLYSSDFLNKLPSKIKSIGCRDNYFTIEQENYPNLVFNDHVLID